MSPTEYAAQAAARTGQHEDEGVAGRHRDEDGDKERKRREQARSRSAAPKAARLEKKQDDAKQFQSGVKEKVKETFSWEELCLAAVAAYANYNVLYMTGPGPCL